MRLEYIRAWILSSVRMPLQGVYVLTECSTHSREEARLRAGDLLFVSTRDPQMESPPLYGDERRL